MFHPAEWFVERERKIYSQVLNPPSWRERKVQNEMIDRKYEESVRAKENKDNSWADKYDKDFENMNRELKQKDDWKAWLRGFGSSDNNSDQSFWDHRLTFPKDVLSRKIKI